MNTNYDLLFMMRENSRRIGAIFPVVWDGRNTPKQRLAKDNMSLKNKQIRAKMGLHKKKQNARMVICLTPSRRFLKKL